MMNIKSDWQTASRESSNIAPKPEELSESIYLIFAARAYSWRGYFGTHPWLAWKRKNEKQYTVAHVTSLGLGETGHKALKVTQDIPDRHWFGKIPTLIFEARAESAERFIDRAQKLIPEYPFNEKYNLWPGPNSNTFVEHIIRYTPGITVALPPHAIGKDFLTNSNIFAMSPSGFGIQFSLFGLFGFTLGLVEGIEINLFGLTFGIDFLRPALKIPFVGRLGMESKPL